MENLVDESENEAMEVDMEEETQRKRKKRSSTSAINAEETTSPVPPMKIGRRKDDVWKHAKVNGKNKFQCNYCKVEYGGGATKIKAHLGLDGKTGGITKCPNYRPVSAQHQEPTNNVGCSPERETQCAADCDVPSSPISHAQYDPPCVGEYESLVAPQAEAEQYIEMVKNSWCYTGLTLRIHIRKRIYHEFPERSDIVGYTVYCPKGVIFLNSQEVCDEVQNAMEKEIIQILYDPDYGEGKQQHVLFSCCNLAFHKLYSESLCAQDMILWLLHLVSKKCSWLSGVLKEAKEVHRREEWNSIPSKFEHPFSELYVIMQYKKDLQSRSSNQNENFNWKDGEEAFNAINPLIQILILFDSFVPNIGYFYEAMEKAENRIKQCSEANPEKFSELSKLFGSLKANLIMPIHTTAAYLNPSYMHNESSIGEKIKREEVGAYIGDYFLNRSEDKEVLKDELEKYSSKDSSLFTEDAKNMLIMCHPVKWWEEFGKPIPVLRRFAIRLLSQPSSCLSHLCHKPKFDVLNFECSEVLRLNVQMMKEFKELQIFEPIDLSKIDAPLD